MDRTAGRAGQGRELNHWGPRALRSARQSAKAKETPISIIPLGKAIPTPGCGFIWAGDSLV